MLRRRWRYRPCSVPGTPGVDVLALGAVFLEVGRLIQGIGERLPNELGERRP